VATDFKVKGENAGAPFTLTIYRGEGMALAAMNWKTPTPPQDFVGFAIEYRKPGATRFSAARSTKNFPGGPPNEKSTKAPFQRFRWVIFPYENFTEGEYTFRVTPMFMDTHGALSSGDPQEAKLELLRETYPGKLNVTFTRGFVLSQAFVRKYESSGPVETLIAGADDDPLTFTPTHPEAKEALPWMGFEARRAIHEVLDLAIGDPEAEVSVVAFDLNEPFIVDRLKQLGARLRIIIDDSTQTNSKTHVVSGHGVPDSPESRVAAMLPHAERQHLGGLQHNKTIVVQSPTAENNIVLCGSTNFTWRGLFVQNNNAVVLHGEPVAAQFRAAFDSYWDHPTTFRQSPSAELTPLGLDGIDGSIAFSPHSTANGRLKAIAADIKKANSSVLYSLAFLFQTEGVLRDAIQEVMNRDDVLVYGVSDMPVGGLHVLDPHGNPVPVAPASLAAGLPPPFSEEPKRTNVGNYMHHKFVVIDFDTPEARVYLGSYNFSLAADNANGENLLLFKDGRIATAYAIEALRIYDHYAFRASPEAMAAGAQPLRRPPGPGEVAWWDRYYTDEPAKRDRLKFA
jgi:phosphatidylserine/phosphatidylglycerophosphate/cardiolipin synthase-like enzyme